MAATVAIVGAVGEFDIVQVTPDTSYPTGGYAVAGLPRAKGIVVPAGRAAGAGATSAVPIWNGATSKLQFFLSNGASPALLNEAPNTTNLSTEVVLLLAA